MFSLLLRPKVGWWIKLERSDKFLTLSKRTDKYSYSWTCPKNDLKIGDMGRFDLYMCSIQLGYRDRLTDGWTDKHGDSYIPL